MSETKKKRSSTAMRGRSKGGENSAQQTKGSASNKSKMNQDKPKYQRQASYDHVRKIVLEEGREARNLITWNVPVDDDKGAKTTSSHTSEGDARLWQLNESKNRRSRSVSGPRASSVGGKQEVHAKSVRPKDLGMGISLKGELVVIQSAKEVESKESPQLNSSQSSGSGTPKKRDLRARYWAFLFENLKRAVDEIYQTCEADESVVECKEVIMMLESCTKDFKSLIERLELLKAFEAADEEHKPTSLAWELRKSSPGKGLSSSLNSKDFVPSPAVVRNINFSAPPDVKSKELPGSSWADRVRGIKPNPQPAGATESASKSNQVSSSVESSITAHSAPNQSDSEHLDEDADGWKTVQRGNKTRRPLSVGGKDHMSGKPKNPSAGDPAKKVAAVKQLSSSTISNQSVLVDRRGRNRTSSLESEKENQPIDEKKPSKEVMVPTKSLNKGRSGESQPIRIEDLQDPSIITKGASYKYGSSSGAATEQKEPDCRASLDVKGKITDNADLLVDVGDVDEEEEKLVNALASALEDEEDLCTKLEKEQEEALESAIQEEEGYLQEIAREESREFDTEIESELETTSSSTMLEKSLDWDTMVQEYEMEAESQTKSWADMAEEAESRTPGRVVHIHERLSSPSRKRSPTETRRRFEQKQAKAQELREKLKQEKAERLRMLTKKVEEVHAWKEELIKQQRETLQRKLMRAAEKRSIQLKLKVRKAHEEETKANEIAFINSLEAQNKRHDIFTKYQESEARLHDLQEERQRKHEEKLAKEAAVEERRRALEAERQARLHEMQERRRHREEIIEQRQQEKEKERLEIARAKEQCREERIAALNAQQYAHIKELQKKIQQKQEDSVRRHREQLEQIQGKALRMSILRHSTEDHNEAPKLAPYEIQKFCSVCSVMIPSEVHLSSHLHGKKHKQALAANTNGKHLSKQEIEEFNLLHISDAPCDETDSKVANDKERQKALKKRCKKIRQRMSQRGTEYEITLSSKQQILDSEYRAKLQKVIKDLNKYLQGQDKGPWQQNKVSALDRGLGEIGRILEKRNASDQTTFRLAGGLTTLCRIMLAIGDMTPDATPVIPVKSLIHCCTVFRLACKGCYDNCHYMLFSNKAGTLVDLLSHQLNTLVPDVVLSSSGGATSLHLPQDPLATSLMQLIATILSVLAKHNPMAISSEASAERMSTSGDAFMSRANDIVSYIISIGILDRLTKYFNNVRGSIDGLPRVAEFLQHSMGLLIAMIRIISKRNVNVFDGHRKDDTTQLVSTFQVTGLVGIVSLMYGMLLHSGTPPRGVNTPPELPAHSLTVATVSFRMLNHLATLDLQMLQSSLGEEGTSLEIRHISSYLLWYCGHWNHEELLHEVILSVGYFTVLNNDNQAIIQSGQPPTVLQQLCSLPFQYFSDPKLTNVLFPTLITCCYNNATNRAILEQELSCDLLANFIEEKALESQTKSPTVTKKAKPLEKELDTRMSFVCRFPKSEWPKAQDYFKTKK